MEQKNRKDSSWRKAEQVVLPVVALATGGTTIAACAGSKKTEEPRKPYNIVYIMTDDHTQQMMSCYDTTHVRTPNLDRIAEGGVRFTNSFVANSISGPSRACMLTGKHSHKNGFTDNEHSAFDGSQLTFPKVLQQAGYSTAIVGKWHLHTLPTGFDHWEILPGQGDYYNPEFIEMTGDTVHQKGYVTNLITDKSIAWLKEHLSGKDKEKPFCLLVHHKAVHRDWLPDLKDLELYEDKTFALPATFYDNYEGRPAAAAQEMSIDKDMDLVYDTKMWVPGVKSRLGRYYEQLVGRLSPEDRETYQRFYLPLSERFYREKLTGRALAEWKYQRYMRDYAKVLHSVDDNVGRLLDYLEEQGLMENTIVVYTSDQGFYMGEHGWFDKRFMYEESMRTPLVMHLPKGLKMRGDIEAIVQNIDYAPTFVELAGAAVPEEMQGESLLPLLKGEKALPSGRDALYYHFYEYPAEHAVKRHYGLRTERYKIIHFYNDIDKWELYDLAKDREELHNQFDNPNYRKVRADMMARLVTAEQYYQDTLALRLTSKAAIAQGKRQDR